MLEIEMKFAVADFGPLTSRLRQWQAATAAPRREEDHYFNAPDRDFGKTDEALRLRVVGGANILTYKGPKHAGPTKTRTEIEVPLQDGEEAAQKCRELVTHLGYRPVAVVRKQRSTFHGERAGFPLNVTLDEVEEVGRFVEVEIVAGEDQRESAQKVLQELAGELGLVHSERRSYLEMLLQKRGLL